MMQGFSRQWAIALLLIGTSATAHHNSGAVFDIDREIILEGTVTRFEWRNPHVYIYVGSTAAQDAGTQWRIEAGPTALMRRFGWTPDTLAAGDSITATVNPSRRAGRASGFLVTAAIDGQALPALRGESALQTLATNAGPSFASGADLTGVWITLLNIDAIDALEETPDEALTAAGIDSRESFDEATMHPGLDCTPFTAPLTMVTPDVKQIAVAGNTLVLRSEFHDAERVVHLSATGTSDGPSIQGQTVGRWEGNTLVMDTTAFAEHRSGVAFGIASSAMKRLRETLTLSEDRSSLTYRFELTDPVYLAQPLSGEAEWAYRPDIEYAGLPCDPENSRRFLDD